MLKATDQLLALQMDEEAGTIQNTSLKTFLNRVGFDGGATCHMHASSACLYRRMHMPCALDQETLVGKE